MWELTTTSWLIWTLSWLQSKKLEYQALVAKLEAELEQSELVQRINKGKELLRELNLQEIEIKNQWLEILEKAGLDKFEANWIEVRRKESIWRLVIHNEDELSDYKKEKITYTIDKKQIKEDLKEWVIIEWVSIEKNITLEIKYK